MTKLLSASVVVTICIAVVLTATVHVANASVMRYPGLYISADHFDWDTKHNRLVLTGGSPTIILTDRKVTFNADWIKIIFAEQNQGALQPERILLHGGSPSITAEEQGMKLEAADIEIVAPKTKGITGIDSASAKGNVRLTQENGDKKANASADSLMISESGDKAVLTGKVYVDGRNPQRHITLTASDATITGLKKQPGSPFNAHLVAGGAAPDFAKLDVEGVLTAKAGVIDATPSMVAFNGDSPIVNWIEQKTTLEGDHINVYMTAAAKGPTSQIERIHMQGKSSKITSEPQGLILTAGSIDAVPPKTKGQGPIESASANGNVHLVRSKDSDHLDSTSQTMEISDRGDKAVFTDATMDISNSQYQGKLTGRTVTLTGLQAPAGSTANRRLLAEGEASAFVAGQMDARADTIDITNERAILKGGSPKAELLQSKSSVEAGVIAVSFITTQGPKGNQMAVDKISLREGLPKAVSVQQGLTLTAEKIDATAPREPGGGPIETVVASGKVHLVQSQESKSEDITADALEMKDKGDTAVLTGNVTVITKDPQTSSKETGDKATITHLLAKPGQKAAPIIALEGKQGHIHVESTAPVKPKPAGNKPSAKSKHGRHNAN